MKPILTILDYCHFSPAAVSLLNTQFEVVWRQALAAYHSHLEPMADVVWTRLQKVDIDRYPHLKVIATNCTGTDHIDLEECERRGVEVLSLKGIEGLDTVHATAEHTINLMLQALRHRADRSSGRIGRELKNKNVALVGHGRIAKQLCKMLGWGFDANIFYPYAHGSCCEKTDKPLWERYDIVSIHASLNETSKGMVNADFLAKLKPGCILVNTARDKIVDSTAILEWLTRDKEAIYAHDFADEWIGAFPHERIIGTPHIGGWTIESLHKTEELLAEKVIEWAKARMEVACSR